MNGLTLALLRFLRRGVDGRSILLLLMKVDHLTALNDHRRRRITLQDLDLHLRYRTSNEDRRALTSFTTARTNVRRRHCTNYIRAVRFDVRPTRAMAHYQGVALTVCKRGVKDTTALVKRSVSNVVRSRSHLDSVDLNSILRPISFHRRVIRNNVLTSVRITFQGTRRVSTMFPRDRAIIRNGLRIRFLLMVLINSSCNGNFLLLRLQGKGIRVRIQFRVTYRHIRTFDNSHYLHHLPNDGELVFVPCGFLNANKINSRCLRRSFLTRESSLEISE